MRYLLRQRLTGEERETENSTRQIAFEKYDVHKVNAFILKIIVLTQYPVCIYIFFNLSETAKERKDNDDD